MKTYQRIKYTNARTSEATTKASEAIAWHRAGDDVEVIHYIGMSYTPDRVTTIKGAATSKPDENREHCKAIADRVEDYADGLYYECPACDEKFIMPYDVGDKFRCPACGEVHDVEDYEQLSLYDYLSDMLDIDYLVNSEKEYKACRILVAFGGPNIYIDTLSQAVELYWYSESAKYYLSNKARNAIDEIAEEFYNN